MAAEISYAQVTVPKFDGHYYDHWSELMENFLRSKEMWNLVEAGIPEEIHQAESSEQRTFSSVVAERTQQIEGQRKQMEEQLKKQEERRKEREVLKLTDLKVKNFLYQAIDRTIMETILNRDTSKHIWDSMKQKYQGSTKVKRAQRQSLRKEFETLQMKEGESVDQYFARTLAIVNKMKAHDERMEQVVIVEKILRSMTSKFDYVICSIEESNNVDILSIDELHSSLLVHEQRMKAHERVSEEQALKITMVERNNGGGGRGRGSFRGRGRGRGRQAFSKATVECYKCHKLGHFQYECPSWSKEANYAELDKEDEMLLMSYVELHEAKREDAWFLDSGCSNHMCGVKAMFAELDEKFSHSVKLGNNSRMNVAGKGKLKLLINGVNLVVTDVYYVPELKNNLLSIGQLQERGLAILIKGGMCKIYHPERGLIIKTDMSANRMFVLFAQSQEMFHQQNQCLHTSSQNLSQLWHRRYGHLSYKGLKTLQNKEMVRGLPKFPVSNELCTDCIIGKHHRDPIPKKSSWRASQVLDLIHADICGPITPISNSNKRYTLCFIDDFSRKSWMYYLVEKSEALFHFKCFKKMVENETGLAIKCLRTDRGGEFTSTDFNKFCQENGIKRQLTTAYTPQQNGVAERKNRTVMNMVRAMLSDKKIPKSFWPEAVNWSNYVLNRCPTVAVIDVTPEEAWSGMKPCVEHFRVFGCIAHVHVPKVRRSKLDNRSLTCVFLGVSEESKGYKLFDPIGKKVLVSRDVIFEEDKQWDWDVSYEEQIMVDLEWGDDGAEVSDDDGGEDENNDGVENDDEDVGETSSGERDGDVSPNIEDSEDREIGEDGKRMRQPPPWMKDYVSGEGLGLSEDETNMALVESNDPLHYEDAVKNASWRLAMDSEINSIEKNKTWTLVELPIGAKKIGVKWVYKTKYNEHGDIDKHKARLVAKGYSQEHGVDYTEVFAPVARLETVRMIIALAAQKGWKIFQLDVKSAFLHGELSEDVYVEQPRGYEKKGNEHLVYKLHKALYGLKQAPRAWFSRIEAHFIKEGFQKCPTEQTLFTKLGEGGKILIVCIYVDDLIFTGNDDFMVADFKSSMLREFDMSDLGRMRFFLGIEVLQRDEGIYICQRKYALDVLKRFGMEKSNAVCNPIVPGFKIHRDEDGVKVDETYYKQIVGSLMYLTATRPDMMFVVSLISRYMARPTELHMQAAKRALRYLKGTVNLGIFYKKGGTEELLAFTDSDYAGDAEDSKSTSGYVFLLSNGAISWSSRKQSIVTLSTTEAEFVAAAGCACQTVWMRGILEELGHLQQGSTTIMCDNSSTIKLSKNPVFHGRSKHIRVRFHFLRDLTKDGTVELMHCGTQDQLADILTKPLKLDAFVKLREQLGMCSISEVN